MRVLCFVMAAGLVSACSPAPEVARHTVDEYRADEAMRDAMLARCTNDPGTLGKTPDCVNANQAERLQSHRSLRDIPPSLPVPDPAMGMTQVTPGERVVRDRPVDGQ
jgi:hypothetical protein